MRVKINHQLILSDIELEKVRHISDKLRYIENEVLSTVKPYEFTRRKAIRLVFIKLTLLTKILSS